MKTVLVHMADHEWTTQAMHLACAMARNMGRSVVLLRLIRVSTPYLLGSALPVPPPSDEEEKAIVEYMMIAGDYGVQIELQPMHYESLTDAVVQAAQHLKAGAVFLALPKTVGPFWRRLQWWTLQRRVNAPVYTLERSEPMGDYTPAISIQRVRQS
jgi:hypothetical protein